MANKMFQFLGLFLLSAILMGIAAELPTSIVPAIVKIVVLIIALLADITAFTSRYYSYLIGPFFRRAGKNVIISKEPPYTIATSSDSLLKKEGDDFIATVFISVPLYRSATEMTDEEKLDFSNQVSRFIGLSRDPVRFTTQLDVMNKDDYIQKLRDTIASTENEEAELLQKNAPKSQIERARGKLAMWRNMLDSIGGSPSYELVSYITVSAVGSKEYEAVSIAQQKAREIMSGVGSVFGVTPNIITGPGLLKFVEPEALIPFSTVTEQINKEVQEQVI